MNFCAPCLLALLALLVSTREGSRLKFRLKPDGVLFGWDIERPDGGLSRFDMPGGDFLRLAQDHGLLLTRCGSVHSAFMRQTIDVIYLDRQGRVLRCVAALRPWRASLCPGAAHVLELAAGSIARYHIAPGDRLLHACFRR